jgi:hypothetical protein
MSSTFSIKFISSCELLIYGPGDNVQPIGFREGDTLEVYGFDYIDQLYKPNLIRLLFADGRVANCVERDLFRIDRWPNDV